MKTANARHEAKNLETVERERERERERELHFSK